MADAQNKQIDNMIGFIASEAREKKAELEQEAQEMYTIEKGRQIEAEKKRIKAEFERKKQQVSVEKRIKQSNLQKEQRLRVLKEREDCMQEMQKLAREKLVEVTKNQANYQTLLANLIAESVMTFKILDVPLEVQALERDKSAVNSAINPAKALIKKHTNKDVTITLSGVAVPEDQIGGVVVSTKDQRIRSNNTLKAREESILIELLPRFRKLLFDD
eukprot:TRINITY_DN5606_c0_g1_i2.p1 TRINITY_DN5606_c0_g1~~TRINITY_DN5606_c0_g1_i2.p1  ORF type:complete len:217 (+),score=60.26 TRINITY_DN5606_c0_g1_i2:60-710(+)